MFQHVTVLVSFIFAIALTHVFSSASQLLLARDRVRFSALLTVSMVNATLGVIINWLGLWELQNLKHCRSLKCCFNSAGSFRITLAVHSWPCQLAKADHSTCPPSLTGSVA